MNIKHIVNVKGSRNYKGANGLYDTTRLMLSDYYFIAYSGLLTREWGLRLEDLMNKPLLTGDDLADTAIALGVLTSDLIDVYKDRPDAFIDDDELYVYNRLVQGSYYDEWKRNLPLWELHQSKVHGQRERWEGRILDDNEFSLLKYAPITLKEHCEILRTTFLGTAKEVVELREKYGHTYQYPKLENSYNENNTIVDLYITQPWQVEAISRQFEEVEGITAEQWVRGKCISITAY